MSRRWMLLFYFVACVFVVAVFLQVEVPSPDILRLMRWVTPEPESVKTIPCQPARNIMFLKTHKSASTSVQNLFLRYADEKGLIVAVPPTKQSQYFSLLRPFQKDMATGVPWEMFGFNVLCHHMVFNGPVLKSFMPENTVFVSIVRDPVNLFESNYEYSKLQDFYKMDIEEFARNTKNATLLPKLQARSNGMGRNQMLYDFGVHPSFFNSIESVQSAIEKLDSYFDFVMIAEFFDESIILLRHLLCWDLDDVVSLTLNARSHAYRRNLTDEATRRLKTWNWGDQMLYNHFLQRFNRTVDEIGHERLREEVEELRSRRQYWTDSCVEKKVISTNQTAYRIWSNKVEGYIVKPNASSPRCENFVKPEGYYTSEIRQKQLLRSLAKGVKVQTYGPKSLSRLMDLKYLKGDQQQLAIKLIQKQYKYRRYVFKKKH